MNIHIGTNAVPHDPQLPPLSAVDYFRLPGQEMLDCLAESIKAFAEQNPRATILPEHSALVAWSAMYYDVPNGGFAQFFFNHGGDAGVAQLSKLFEELALPKIAALLRDAAAV